MPPLFKMHVLIVDDNAMMREVVSKMLSTVFECTVYKASCVSTALSTLAEHSQDLHLLLLDYEMPNTNGLEAYQIFKEAGYLDFPVMMLTGANDTDLAVSFMKIGGHDFVTKPVSDWNILYTRMLKTVELYALNEQFEIEHTARVAAEKSKEAMEVFVAKMSHELGTPAHHISSSLHIIDNAIKQNDLIKASKWLETAKKSTARLKHVTEDFLDITKLKIGKFTLRCMQSRMSTIAQEAIDEIHLRYPDTEIDLSISIDTEEYDGFFDPLRMYQVLINLLENAICHAINNTSIEIRIEKIDDQLSCSVSDQGEDMDPEKIKPFFTPFNQGGDAYNSSGKLGLGLTISKEIIDLHGGTLNVTENKPQGICFIFNYPIYDGASTCIPKKNEKKIAQIM